ncbi:MAG: signal peptidase II [Clostridia bacterium]|nr:signal peptidase II [Clostridia bacterium]
MSDIRRLSGAWIALVALALDQWSKRAALRMNRPVEWAGLFALRPTANSGVAFSLLAGNRLPLILVTALVLLALAVALLARPDWFPRAARTGLWMVLGGGVGNLIDRLRMGEVIDFIEPLFVRFATFNVADCFVVVGALVAAIALLAKPGGGQPQ